MGKAKELAELGDKLTVSGSAVTVSGFNYDNIVDSAPGALNTLNELAAAIGDDASFSTTVTNSIATKLPLAGGTMTGNINLGNNVKANFGASTDLEIYNSGYGSYIKYANATYPLRLQSDNFQIQSANGGTTKLVVDSSGRLLVGKTSSNYATEGVEIRSNEILITKAGANPLSVRNNGAGGLISLNSAGTTIGGIGIESSGFYVDGEASHAGLKLFASAIGPRQNGADIDATIDLGWSSGKFKDLYLSGSVTANNIAASGAASSFNSGATNVVASFTSTDATAGIQLVDNTGNVELSALGSTFQVQPGGGTPTLSVSSQLSEPIATVVGGGYGYTHGAIALKSSTGYDARVRGQGIFLFNEENDTTWYAGTPYLNTSAGSRPFDFNFQSGTTSLSAITATGTGTYTAARIHASGVISTPAGIELGSGVDATAANTLDDYEEGNFTPVLSWYTPSNGSVTYQARTATYVKVGRKVTIHLEMRLNVVSQNSATLPLLVSGFPFPFLNTGGYGGSLMQVSLQGFTFSSGHIPFGWGEYNSDRMFLFTMSSNALNNNLATPANYKTINVSGTYITTT